MVLTDTPGSSFDKVALDVVGPLNVTETGFRYVLTMQDLLTKFSIATTLEGIDPPEIAEAFLKRLVFVHGSPKIVLTDQGKNFTSVLIRNVAKFCKIRTCATTAFRPQSNGSVERMHHSFSEWIKMYLTRIRDWDSWCECATFSYNTSVHEATKFTPYECVYGKIARVPSATVPIDTEMNETYLDHIARLRARLLDVQGVARVNLQNAKIRSKKYYDARLNPCNFKVGDRVMLIVEPKKKKYAPEYTGPHKVLEILNGGKNIKITYRKKSRIVHPNKLRKTRLDIDSE